MSRMDRILEIEEMLSNKNISASQNILKDLENYLMEKRIDFGDLVLGVETITKKARKGKRVTKEDIKNFKNLIDGLGFPDEY